MKLKIRLARSTAFAIASYGCESWTFSPKVEKKVKAFEMWTYRRLLRVSWQDRRTNEWVLQQIGSKQTLLPQLVRRKMKFFGHAIRHDKIEKSVIQGKVEGSRGRGRPMRAWHTDIEQWLGCSLHQASQLTHDRKLWRHSMKATAALYEPPD